MKEKKEKESSEDKKREKEYSERFRKLKENYKSGSTNIRNYKQELKTIRGAEKIAKERNDSNTLKQLRNEEVGVLGGLTGERAKPIGRGVLSGMNYAERTSERLGSALAKQLKKPLLKKPSVSIKTISSKGLLKQFSRTNYGEIKEGRDYSQQPEQDRSNLFFQTLNRERKNNRGWL